MGTAVHRDGAARNRPVFHSGDVGHSPSGVRNRPPGSDPTVGRRSMPCRPSISSCRSCSPACPTSTGGSGPCSRVSGTPSGGSDATFSTTGFTTSPTSAGSGIRHRIGCTDAAGVRRCAARLGWRRSEASCRCPDDHGRGVDGDTQADRRHHGRPVQAVCLWGSDVIEQLRGEGHPIAPGAAGENITIGGVDWSELLPGSRMDVGCVPMLISAHAIPCGKNARWFHDRDFSRIHHDRRAGASRLYAIPLTAGEVSVGDPVTIEPPSGNG